MIKKIKKLFFKKICEECKKRKRVREYCFKNPAKQWTRRWCKKCLKKWMKKPKSLDEITTKYITRLDKIKKKLIYFWNKY